MTKVSLLLLATSLFAPAAIITIPINESRGRIFAPDTENQDRAYLLNAFSRIRNELDGSQSFILEFDFGRGRLARTYSTVSSPYFVSGSAPSASFLAQQPSDRVSILDQATGQFTNGASLGTNYLGLQDTLGRWGWLKFTMTENPSSELPILSIDSFSFDPSADSIATAPRILEGQIVSIPEPTSLLLLSCGLASLLRRSRGLLAEA